MGGTQRGRSTPDSPRGHYAGQQAADRLGIGLTTLNRWIKAGRVPKPRKSISEMLLFERAEIDQLFELRQWVESARGHRLHFKIVAIPITRKTRLNNPMILERPSYRRYSILLCVIRLTSLT